MSIKQAGDMILQEVIAEEAIMLKQFRVQGSVPCLSCGYGQTCEQSNIPLLYGNKRAATTKNCIPVEQQSSWKKANDTGIMLGKLIRQEVTLNRFIYKLKVMKFMLPKFPAIMNAKRWARKGLGTIALRK